MKHAVQDSYKEQPSESPCEVLVELRIKIDVIIIMQNSSIYPWTAMDSPVSVVYC